MPSKFHHRPDVYLAPPLLSRSFLFRSLLPSPPRVSTSLLKAPLTDQFWFVEPLSVILAELPQSLWLFSLLVQSLVGSNNETSERSDHTATACIGDCWPRWSDGSTVERGGCCYVIYATTECRSGWNAWKAFVFSELDRELFLCSQSRNCYYLGKLAVTLLSSI